MEKHYEKPEAQVVRYRKRVKTNAEFTDSSGVQHIGDRCPYCNKVYFTIRTDQLNESTPEEDIERLAVAYKAAAKAHYNECPNVTKPPIY